MNFRPELIFFITDKTIALIILCLTAISLRTILYRENGLDYFFQFVIAQILLLVNDLVRFTGYLGTGPKSPLFYSLELSLRLAILTWAYFMLLLYAGITYKFKVCLENHTMTKFKIVIYNIALFITMIPLMFPDVYKQANYGMIFYKKAGYSVMFISLFIMMCGAIYYLSYDHYDTKNIYIKTLIFAAAYCVAIGIGREIKPYYSSIVSTIGSLTVLWYYLSIITTRTYIDEMTGLNNDKSFGKYIDKYYERLNETSDAPLRVIVYQISGIDTVNTLKGIKAGDDVLKKFADILKIIAKSSRIDLFAGRISGSKFVIATYTSNKSELSEIKQDILEQFERMKLDYTEYDCIRLKYGETESLTAKNKKMIYKLAHANMHEAEY